MKKIKPRFLSITEIQEIMKSDRYMPTAIFSAKKTDYIVKPRTIFGNKKKGRKGSIRW